MLRTGLSHLVFVSGPLIALAVLWVLFAPVELGGRTAYVITRGVSMLPHYQSGDLVILREGERFEIGDVVAYRDPQIGRVLHRVHEREGERFIMKGDNNGWLDSYQPTADDILGRRWIHLPKVGDWFAMLQQPRYAAVLAAVGGLIVAGPTGRKQRLRRRSRRSASTTGGGPLPSGGEDSAVGLGTGGQAALTILTLVGLASVLLALIAFRAPTEVTVPAILGYQQSGTFSYSAPVTGDVYDGRTATTGQPIFRKLANHVDFRFDYAFSSELPAAIGGTAQLDALLGRDDGWTRRIPLQAATPFDGQTATLSGTLELGTVQALLDDLREQAGFSEHALDRATLDILPTIDVEGSMGGEVLAETFTPVLSFQLDAVTLRLDQPGGVGTEESPLGPSMEGELTTSRIAANTLPLLFVELEVATARAIAGVGLLITLFGLGVLGLLAWRASRAAEPAKIRARFAPLLVSLRDSDLGATGRVIDVATIVDLARVAEREGRMILHEQRGSNHDYFVHDVEVTYRYSIIDDAANAEDETEQRQQPMMEASP